MNKKKVLVDSNCEHIAYPGSKFTVEWYYNEKGKSEALNYYKKLDDTERAKILALFVRIGDHGKINNKEKFRNEGDDIYAFKADQERFLSFFMKGKKIIVAHAFRKKSQLLPPKEKDIAIKRKDDYIQRCEKGEYYG